MSQERIHALVVDDDPEYARSLRYILGTHGYQVTTVSNGDEALAVLRSPGEAGPVDLIVSDVTMPVMNGHEFLESLRAEPKTAEIPFMFLSARVESADKLTGFRLGADDYLCKPADTEELLARVQVLARRARLTLGVRGLLPPAQRPGLGDLYAKVARWEARFPMLAVIRRDSIVGASPSILALLRDILKNTVGSDPVLIVGETGSGKTGVAEALHQLSARREKPFVVINCAELGAADSAITLGRLFGFGKNSGLANVPKEGQRGLLEEADGGTVFFDEVHRLPAAAQGQLLLAIEGRPFQPVAGKRDPLTVNVRFVFATNRDLQADAAAGAFPFDLYQRMNSAPIHVPPLRDRRDDIGPLAEHFLHACAEELAIANATFSPSLLQAIVARDYPGNIRELRNLVRQIARAAAFEEDTVLALEHAGELFHDADRAADRASISTAAAPDARDALWNEVELRELTALRANRFRIIDAERALGLSVESRTLTNHLRGYCFKALSHHGFDVAKAARAVVGGDDEALIARTTERIASYLDTVAKHVAAHSIDTLRNNLQIDYRRHLDSAVARARDLFRSTR